MMIGMNVRDPYKAERFEDLLRLPLPETLGQLAQRRLATVHEDRRVLGLVPEQDARHIPVLGRNGGPSP